MIFVFSNVDGNRSDEQLVTSCTNVTMHQCQAIYKCIYPLKPISLPKSNSGSSLDLSQIDLVPNQRSNIIQTISIHQLDPWELKVGLEPTHLIIVGRSQLIPQPRTLTFLGIPIGSSISGRKIPDCFVSDRSGKRHCQRNVHWQSRSISLILHDTRKSPYLATLSAPFSQEGDGVPRYKG